MDLAVEPVPVRHQNVVAVRPVACFGAAVGDTGAGVFDECFNGLNVRDRSPR